MLLFYNRFPCYNHQKYLKLNEQYVSPAFADCPILNDFMTIMCGIYNQNICFKNYFLNLTNSVFISWFLFSNRSNRWISQQIFDKNPWKNFQGNSCFPIPLQLSRWSLVSYKKRTKGQPQKSSSSYSRWLTEDQWASRPPSAAYGTLHDLVIF